MTRPPSKPRASRSGPSGETEPPAKRRGRPPAGDIGRTQRLTTTLTPDEQETCELAAQRDGKTLSEWARNTLLLRAAGAAS